MVQFTKPRTKPKHTSQDELLLSIWLGGGSWRTQNKTQSFSFQGSLNRYQLTLLIYPCSAAVQMGGTVFCNIMATQHQTLSGFWMMIRATGRTLLTLKSQKKGCPWSESRLRVGEQWVLAMVAMKMTGVGMDWFVLDRDTIAIVELHCAVISFFQL